MSLFTEDVDKITSAIQYFNSLDAQTKSFIVANIYVNPLSPEQITKLSPLIEAIQNNISRTDETTISHKLFELGMDETYATLLVKNIIKNAPTVEYHLSILSRMSDAEFKEKFSSVIKDTWLDKKPIDGVLSDNNVHQQQLDAIMGFSRFILNGYCRYELSKDKIKEISVDNGMTDDKIDTVINTTRVFAEEWRKMLVFSNTQDSFFSAQTLKQQNQQILSTLKDILLILKQFQNNSKNPTHIQ